MSKGKLAKFADMATYENVFQYPYPVVSSMPFDMRGHWHEQYFHNDNPIILELGCGKGEYAVDLARRHQDFNFIGVDIKGARMWTGATQALNEGLKNVAFLRTNIEIIDRFFAQDEVEQLWLTFSDPQMKNVRKRLTSTYFLERYRRFLIDGGVIHLKTDSNFLFTYTTVMARHNSLPIKAYTTDLYQDTGDELAEARSVQTYYEKMWLSRGIGIKYMQMTLPRSTPLEEPGVEIPLDEYRSYHRTKRSSAQSAK